MRTEVVTITPEMAADMLTRNCSNRPLRRHVVEYYARQMRSGAWRLTHQGIAVDTAGTLVDGQHRLWAIVQSNVAVRMMVTTMSDYLSAMGAPVDLGLGRTFGDILALPKKHIEIIRLLQEIADYGARSRRLSTEEVAMTHRHLKGELEALAAPMLSALCAHRLATVLSAIMTPERADDIRQQSSWFAAGSNCTQYWSSVEGFNQHQKKMPRAHWNGVGGRMDYVIRWRMAMLNPTHRVSRVSNEPMMVREVREQCKDILKAAGVTL